MKYTIFKNTRLSLIIILTFFSFFSCVDKDELSQFEIIETTVKGHVSDVERGFNIENFKLVLVKSWQCTSVVQTAICTEFVDSVRTDANGNYSITFDFVDDGKDYVFAKQYYGSPYYTEFSEGRIRKGELNIKNVDAWYPTVLKLNLNVINNNFPAMRVSNHIIGNNSLHFGTIDIFEEEVDTIVFIRTKPNSDTQLNFHYSTGYSNSDYHHLIENITTALQDTISLSYNIDCSAF